jgi:hypothetical protein
MNFTGHSDLLGAGVQTADLQPHLHVPGVGAGARLDTGARADVRNPRPLLLGPLPPTRHPQTSNLLNVIFCLKIINLRVQRWAKATQPVLSADHPDAPKSSHVPEVITAQL